MLFYLIIDPFNKLKREARKINDEGLVEKADSVTLMAVARIKKGKPWLSKARHHATMAMKLHDKFLICFLFCPYMSMREIVVLKNKPKKMYTFFESKKIYTFLNE